MSAIAESMSSEQHTSAGGRARLKQRILMTTLVVSPTPISDAFVVNGLLSQLDTDEVVVAAERWPYNPNDQTHESHGHRVHFIGSKWTWPKRGQRYLHWCKWLVIPRTVYRLIRLARREKCQAIFANFPDEQLLFAAYLVSRLLGLKLFAFFHNTYRDNRSNLAYLLASWLQPRVFERAQVVFVMSDGMKQEWQAHHPDVEFQPLVHTFEGAVPAFQQLPPIDRSRIRLGYLGWVSQANLDALQRICQVVQASHDLELNLYSGSPAWYLQKEGLTGEQIRHQQPADEQLLDSLRANDILFLPHGLTGSLAPIEYRTMFPTRTIPCLLAGRPILAHSAQDSFLSHWLRRHDCAQLVEDPDPAALRAAIDRLCNDAVRREQLVRNALAAAEQFRADHVVADLKRTINAFLP